MGEIRRSAVSGRRRRAAAMLVIFAILVSGLAVGAIEPATAAVGSTTTFTWGPDDDAPLRQPTSIAPGPDGNLWFVDEQISRIGRITTAGSITTFADPAIVSPHDITAGPDGAMWFTSVGSPVIGRITLAGEVTTFTAPGLWSLGQITAGPDGNLWFTDSGSLGRITPAGTITVFDRLMINPTDVVAGPDGNIWFTDTEGFFPESPSIGRMTTDGTMLASFGGGTIHTSQAITVGGDGNLWFASGYDAVGRVTPAGVVTTFALPATGPPDHYYHAESIATGPDGSLWLTQREDDSIRRVTTAGVVQTFTDTGIVTPSGITAGPDGNMWFTNGPDGSIGRIAPDGTVKTFGRPRIDRPLGIASGADGNLWFTDYRVGAVDRMTPAGVLTTFTHPGIDKPGAITAGPDGNLWFANSGNDTIGRITPAGAITIFDDPAISVPSGITSGPDGNVWFTNRGGASVGRITPAGVVTTFTDPGILQPFGIAAGADGTLWFTDIGNRSVTSITTDGMVANHWDHRLEGPLRIAAGAGDDLWVTDSSGSLARLNAAGLVTELVRPDVGPLLDLALGPDGNVWVTAPGLGWILRVTPDGVVTTYPQAWYTRPTGIVAGPERSLWFTNNGSHSIGRIVAVDVSDAPVGVVASGRDGGAEVRWTPPAPSGTPITGYSVTASPGGAGCTWSTGATACTVTGLTNGVAYTFTVTATNAIGTSAPSSPSDAVMPFHFDDVSPSTPFHDDIGWLVTKGITTGYPDGTFRPTTALSRGAIAAFLYRALGSPYGAHPPCATAPFVDVPVGAPFCGEIAWAKDAAILKGYPDGTFRSAVPSTREALAAFLYRAAGSPYGTTTRCSVEPFTDVPRDAPFCGEIAWMKGYGVTTGFPDGTFHPRTEVSRGAMAAFLHRLEAVT